MAKKKKDPRVVFEQIRRYLLTERRTVARAAKRDIRQLARKNARGNLRYRIDIVDKRQLAILDVYGGKPESTGFEITGNLKDALSQAIAHKREKHPDVLDPRHFQVTVILISGEEFPLYDDFWVSTLDEVLRELEISQKLKEVKC